MSPKRRMFWNVRATPRRVINPDRSPAISWESNRIAPAVGV